MCTAINETNLFGRTLDLDVSYGECAVLLPRACPLPFRHEESPARHAAIIGTAHIHESVPLFYEAMNEHGLAVAALNFPTLTAYTPLAQASAAVRLASFEVIPYLLAHCANCDEAVRLLSNAAVTDEAFDESFPVTPLHFLIADRRGSAVLECTASGMTLAPHPLGILTNAPTVTAQLAHLANHLHLTPAMPHEGMEGVPPPLSRGTGAIGLPGDYSSPSRFVRAAFAERYTEGETELAEVSRFFHVMETVTQPAGLTRTEDGRAIRTHYTSCLDRRTFTYYVATYACRRIRTLDTQRCDLSGERLHARPLSGGEEIGKL